VQTAQQGGGAARRFVHNAAMSVQFPHRNAGNKAIECFNPSDKKFTGLGVLTVIALWSEMRVNSPQNS